MLRRTALTFPAALSFSLALMLSADGCGGATTAPTRVGIEAIRRRAAERPNDPAAQALWAEAEFLMEDGDPVAAERAIARALEIAPEDPKLHLLHGLERHLHGAPDAALDALLRALTLARTSRDPDAANIAEIALVLVAELDDAVPRFGERVRAVLEPLHADPGAIGPITRHAIGTLLIELAYRRGDIDTVRALSRAQGCPTEWRVAGPFGPRQLLSFDRALPPEEPGPLADAYDLGPGRGVRATRTLEPRGCTLHLGGGPVAGPGTTYSEAEVTVPAAGEYLIRLESPNSVVLFVDDREVARVDRRREPRGRLTFHPIHLEAGAHRILVKTTTRHPNPVLIVALVPLVGEVEDFDRPPAGEGPLATLLRAARHLARADFVQAREVLGPALRDDDAAAPMLIFGAIAAFLHPLMGPQVAADEARRLLIQAAARDERAWYPRFQLARLEPDALERISSLRSAMERWPEVIAIALELVDALEARGWEAQTDEVIAHAARAVPDACRPRRAAMHSALRRERHGEVGRLAEEVVACDARSDARLQHLVRQRRWEEARAELARIAALEPSSALFQRLDAELTLARGQSDDAAVDRLLAHLAELQPRSEAVAVMQADRMLAAGDAPAAQARISSALDERPDGAGHLWRLLRAVGGDFPLEPFRLDGAQVIRDFERSGRSYDGPKVLVLDYTVVYVCPDGSTLELTHNIIRLQSEEAVDQEGEFRPPDDAQLLTLRTVKADGRRLEPDEIQGKDTISMPNLAVGDYVEFEYVRAEPAPAGFPHGVVGDRFYFQSFEVPFDRSELTVILPESIRPSIDRRGPAPDAEETVENGRRVLRWRVLGSRPRPLEPGSVSAREYLPSVLWAHNATWDAYVESLRDLLADRDLRDPAHERLVREIVGRDGPHTPEAIARRIYHWVIENIDDSPDPFGQAATMVHSRAGNRARVLVYLLRLAGLEAELALARSFANDRTPSEIADEETYSFFVVRMRGSHGPLWLWTGARGAPFGFLPLEPMIRGQEALVLSERAERTRVAAPDVESDRARIEVELRLDGEGGAHAEVTETFHGATAVAWRAQLDGVAAAQLEDAFARRYVAQIAGGARLTQLSITGRNEPDEPLVLRYGFDVEQLGRLEGRTHALPQLYRVGLVSNFARIARRTTTQVVTGGARDVVMRVILPEGAHPPGLPAERHASGPHGMEASWRSSIDGRVVTIERRTRIPQARVAPEEYPAFQRFCRTVDEFEETEIRIER
jgi:tetratricopeptide (TPR) repeat protein